jgi:predicted small lipoprotein YifL
MILCGLLSVFCLQGCGQKKPLYLPQSPQSNQSGDLRQPTVTPQREQ